jgi:hypothetical protein
MPSALARCHGEAARVSRHGGVAQLGERLNGIQEVSGSIPLVSIPDQGYLVGIPRKRQEKLVEKELA